MRKNLAISTGNKEGPPVIFKRRSFLKTLAVSLAGGFLAACLPKTAQPNYLKPEAFPFGLISELQSWGALSTEGVENLEAAYANGSVSQKQNIVKFIRFLSENRLTRTPETQVPGGVYSTPVYKPYTNPFPSPPPTDAGDQRGPQMTPATDDVTLQAPEIETFKVTREAPQILVEKDPDRILQVLDKLLGPDIAGEFTRAIGDTNTAKRSFSDHFLFPPEAGPNQPGMGTSQTDTIIIDFIGAASPTQRKLDLTWSAMDQAVVFHIDSAAIFIPQSDEPENKYTGRGLRINFSADRLGIVDSLSDHPKAHKAFIEATLVMIKYAADNAFAKTPDGSRRDMEPTIISFVSDRNASPDAQAIYEQLVLNYGVPLHVVGTSYINDQGKFMGSLVVLPPGTIP